MYSILTISGILKARLDLVSDARYYTVRKSAELLHPGDSSPADPFKLETPRLFQGLVRSKAEPAPMHTHRQVQL